MGRACQESCPSLAGCGEATAAMGIGWCVRQVLPCMQPLLFSDTTRAEMGGSKQVDPFGTRACLRFIWGEGYLHTHLATRSQADLSWGGLSSAVRPPCPVDQRLCLLFLGTFSPWVGALGESRGTRRGGGWMGLLPCFRLWWRSCSPCAALPLRIKGGEQLVLLFPSCFATFL